MVFQIVADVRIKPLMMVFLGLSALLCAGVFSLLPSIPSYAHHSHINGHSELEANLHGESKEIKFTQKLDHFGVYYDHRDTTFEQTVVINDTLWGGAQKRAPIFALLGNEEGATVDPSVYGLLTLLATEFQGLLIHIEHRFYGTSVPFGSIELAMADHQVRGCFSTDQALQDFAIIIQSLKANLSTLYSPVIVVGSGYGGALATWFRMKYPEIAIGAISSSTPLYLFGNTTQPDGFCSIVSKDFQDANPKCYNSIGESWKKIDELASQLDGLAKLSSTFNTCRPLHSAMEIEDIFGQLYSEVALHNDPLDHLLNFYCLPAEKGTLKGIAQARYKYLLDGHCTSNNYIGVKSPFEPISKYTAAWEWQRCSELIFPVGCSEDTTILPSRPFNINKFKQACRERFGIVPQPRTPISFFASKSLDESLVGFGGNIIFTNGLRDPFSGAAILEDLSKTIVAVTTDRGTFSSDMKTLKDDDPKWLKNQRKEVIQLCRPWITITSI